MNLTDRPTPLTDAIFNVRHSGYAEMHDHARRLEQLLAEMAERLADHIDPNCDCEDDRCEGGRAALRHYAELKKGESK